MRGAIQYRKALHEAQSRARITAFQDRSRRLFDMRMNRLDRSCISMHPLSLRDPHAHVVPTDGKHAESTAHDLRHSSDGPALHHPGDGNVSGAIPMYLNERSRYEEDQQASALVSLG